MEGEDQNKSKLAELRSGLHSFNLKNERSQEHRVSLRRSQKVFRKLSYT